MIIQLIESKKFLPKHNNQFGHYYFWKASKHALFNTITVMDTHHWDRESQSRTAVKDNWEHKANAYSAAVWKQTSSLKHVENRTKTTCKATILEKMDKQRGQGQKMERGACCTEGRKGQDLLHTVGTSQGALLPKYKQYLSTQVFLTYRHKPPQYLHITGM